MKTNGNIIFECKNKITPMRNKLLHVLYPWAHFCKGLTACKGVQTLQCILAIGLLINVYIPTTTPAAKICN